MPSRAQELDSTFLDSRTAASRRFSPRSRPLEVVKLSSLDVLVATHAPAIIGEHWDLTVELKGPDLASAA